MQTPLEIARDFALDLTGDAHTGECPACGAGRLGTKLECPTCWAWHADRKRPHSDQRSYVRAVLAEQRELASEANLDAMATEIARVFRSGNPTDSIFFSEIASSAIRCGHMLNVSTSRRRRTLQEVIALLVLDPKVAIGPALST